MYRFCRGYVILIYPVYFSTNGLIGKKRFLITVDFLVGSFIVIGSMYVFVIVVEIPIVPSQDPEDTVDK